ncbi:carbohydrate esterase family 3 protein [Amorphotheca resinae ATCC 22711]|uniref:Carbohydrate esterase family 3 protein n=1 Tax=Amorphotheca resinae ATCC 22711 TaxID=857342 RepID=A0A2T3AUF6_AMORE|nr:carbohydrate esterase family 3 protein [Amorphotheca resinae ATCC 22711]PSS12297.1 carbohydrate esterase family 3 protein [Amorphotheca resinae ATCC 22711]
MEHHTFFLLCAVMLTLPWLATAFPSLLNDSPASDLRVSHLDSHKRLRILPLGDSITWGYLSSDGNGYRLDLLNLLSPIPVQYIGSQRSGNMTDNHNEGHPGALINQIAGYAYASLSEQPNVVLLMAGTNDINDPVNASTAPQRLGSLIDEVVAACPRAAVLVAELTPIANTTSEARAKVFNAAIPGIIAPKVEEGKHVLTVNMSAYVTAQRLKDGLHPTDVGYALMAQAWYLGIQEAAANGWIEPPINTSNGTPLSAPIPSTTPVLASTTIGYPVSALAQSTTLVSASTANNYSVSSRATQIPTTAPIGYPISTSTPEGNPVSAPSPNTTIVSTSASNGYAISPSFNSSTPISTPSPTIPPTSHSLLNTTLISTPPPTISPTSSTPAPPPTAPSSGSPPSRNQSWITVFLTALFLSAMTTF